MKKEHEPQVQAARICFNPTFTCKTLLKEVQHVKVGLTTFWG